MPKKVTIPLTVPIVGHTTIHEIVIQAPGLIQYAQIGDPVSVMRGDGDQVQVVENDAAIARYIEDCIVEPRDKLILNQIDLVDAMTIKDALLDFFVTARLAKISQASQTPSS
jgi:hypothetical protein